MGPALTTIRNMIDKTDEEERKLHERLNVLEKMIHYHLDATKVRLLNGARGNQEIHAGTVVELSQQVNVKIDRGTGAFKNLGNKKQQVADTNSKEAEDANSKTTKDANSKKATESTIGKKAKETSTLANSKEHEEPDDMYTLQESIKSLFDGKFKDGIQKLVIAAIQAVLGNSSMGEHEGNSMFIVWSNNALMRLDTYYYRWNFSSAGIIQGVEGVTGVIVMARIVDIGQTDPQVLTWAISKQASATNESAFDLLGEFITTIERVNDVQQAVQNLRKNRRNEDSESDEADGAENYQ